MHYQKKNSNCLIEKSHTSGTDITYISQLSLHKPRALCHNTENNTPVLKHFAPDGVRKFVICIQNFIIKEKNFDGIKITTAIYFHC